ncbi:MAG: M48 family metalloprotease, partial [Fusobacteriaceae bacterium]|nr:M48 family metalloprotease [Fusobacteriaceae bacterium]
MGADLGNGTNATAATNNNMIFLNTDLLNSKDTSAILTIVSHELGHFNSYDNNADDPEKTANNISSKVGGVEVNHGLTDREKADYLSEVNEKYKNLPDTKTATEIVNLIA